MTLEEFKLQIETTNKCNNCSHFHLKNKKWTQNLKRNQENSVLYFASAWEVACLELQNSCSLPNMTECGLAFRGGSLDASFSFQIKKKMKHLWLTKNKQCNCSKLHTRCNLYLCFWDFSRWGRVCGGYCVRSCIFRLENLFSIYLITLDQALDTLMEHLLFS